MFVSTNTFEAVVNYYRKSLNSIYDNEEVDAIIAIVFYYFKGISKAQLNLKLKDFLSESELLDFHFTLKRLIKGEPIQYVLGETYFYGLKLLVNEHVLIPRPETEELVDLILKDSMPKQTILEIGTGSGCIALALKKNIPNAQITAIDISEDALVVAQKNAQLNNLKVTFSKHDFLDVTLDNDFGIDSLDIVVSNPPYIPVYQKKSMHKNVLDFEPHLALFVENEDPLIFYKRIAEVAKKSLKNGGKFFVEISDSLGLETLEMFSSSGFKNVKLIKDINHNDRIISGEK